MDELAQRLILAIVERALAAADAVGVTPTPIDSVARRAGIGEILDISDLPQDLAGRKPRAWRRILGALLYRERVAFVDRKQPEPRARFTQAHETGHRIIPWHEAAFQLDGDETLFRPTEEKLEAEANTAAAHLLFQGPRFHQRALDYQVSINTPIVLADDYAASRHATIRYYVEHHPDAVAMLAAGRYASSDGSIPLWEAVESPAFRSRFGSMAARLPKGRLLVARGDGRPIGDIVHQAMTGVPVATKGIGIRDTRGDLQSFVAEAFFNGYSVLVMFSERRAVKFGRRVRVAAG